MCTDYQVEIVPDDSGDAPWECSDCHGPVRQGRAHREGSSDKRPGERPLNSARHGDDQFYYDWAEASRMARRDGWGGDDPVQRDFDYLRIMRTESFDNFVACFDDAPDGTYTEAKDVRRLIGEHLDVMIKEVRALGLKADNCDGAYKLEAAIYQWIKDANPVETFASAEGFGHAMGTEARDRVLARATADYRFLQTLGASPKC